MTTRTHIKFSTEDILETIIIAVISTVTVTVTIITYNDLLRPSRPHQVNAEVRQEKDDVRYVLRVQHNS